MKQKILITLGLLLILSLPITWYTLHTLGLGHYITLYPSLEPTTRGALLDYEQIDTIDSDDIAAIYPENEAPITFDYDLTLYRIYYSSIYHGNPIVLSGLVSIPDTDQPLPHYQYHHGTMIPAPSAEGEGTLDAPSLYQGGGPLAYSNQYETRHLILYPSAQGYFASAPDYAGYAISSDEEHPYTYHPELANYSVDMILAAQALAAELDIPLTDKLFLAGWSEGGGAALATHRLITEEYADQLTVTASAPFAGPYNMTGFYNYIATSDEAEAMSIYNWAVYSHHQFHELDADADELWLYAVDSQLTALDIPDNSPEDLYQPDYLAAMRGQTDDLADLWQTIDLHRGWTPTTPVFLHSGTDDEIVPHFNTLDAHANLPNTTLYEYPGGDHESPLFDYIIQMLSDFDQLR
ncbi:MAG TPA: alpha/beta hydrolase [Anaerolineae bacterium]|nr:alpha/beta hydrolase [Anaerolineae bacterium]